MHCLSNLFTINFPSVDNSTGNRIATQDLVTGLAIVCGQDFGYEDDGNMGPSHWGEQYNTCFGKFQSPINIISLMVKAVHLPELEFHDIDLPPNQITIENNGHTVMVSLETDERPTLNGGPLKGTYEFSQLHFHWGENDSMGSEDLIDGRSFPMELHMVFYKKQYRNIRSAMENVDGLAVLAFFFHLEDKDNVNYIEITELLPTVTEPDSSATFTRLKSVRDLISRDLDEYYTYHGSLTTPPCSEVVTWIDFKQSIPLSHSQIQAFRTIQDSEGHHLTHNVRPIQPLGNRDVYFVTPFNSRNELPVGEHSQGFNTSSKSKLSETTNTHTRDDLNENSNAQNIHMNVDQELSVNTVETTTAYQKKLSKFGRNKSINISFSKISLLFSTILTTIINLRV